MVVSGRWIILVWIIAVLLLANSLVILVNIFDFPVSGMRHFISFISALGLLGSLLFVIFSLLQLLNRSKRS